jgi:branched-chain amino acid aminotransferase
MPETAQEQPENPRVVFINGVYVPEGEAKISIFDHGVLYGDAVFDTMCAWNGYVFKMARHLDRLFDSLHAVRLQIPYTREQLGEAVVNTVARNRLRNAYVKSFVSRGLGPEPLIDPRHCEPNVVIFARPYMRLSRAEEEDSGIRARIASVRRIPAECLDPKIKNNNYLNLILAKWEAIDAGVDDIIMLDVDGYVSEGAGYNIFIVKKERLITPPEGVLMGITRETVVALADEGDLPTVEQRFTSYDLYTADEAFFSTTAGGIVPIVEVDGRRIGSGKAGPWTKQLRSAYFELLASGRQGTRVPFG